MKELAEPAFENATALDDIAWMKEQQAYSTPCVGADACQPLRLAPALVHFVLLPRRAAPRTR